MNGEVVEEREPDNVENDEDDDIVADDFSAQTIVIEETDDDEIRPGDMSAEIRVEELVAKIDSDSKNDAEKKRLDKKRLEELEEKIGDDLDSTYNFDLDET